MRGTRTQNELLEGMHDLQAGYAAARRSRFRRVRVGTLAMGSGADYHYAIQTDFLRILEDARDMDRNDGVVGAITDRAVTNLIQDGMTVEPQTGDPEIDTALRDRWDDWANDPDQCDVQQELCFAEMEALVTRHMLVDGDILTLLTDDGSLQLVEAHRLRTPALVRRNCVHGVLLDDQRRRIEYWLTKDNVSPLMQVARIADIIPYKARDKDGHKRVLHVYNPKRVTQTRGVSAYAPMFDFLGMFEDVNFAALVKQQVSACWVAFRELDAAAPLDLPPGQTGPRYAEFQDDGSTRTIEGQAPGVQVRGRRGEKLHGFAPNIPGDNFFEHMRFILTIISNNLGLPLVIALMDASETNFSGYRGALDQARMGWRRNQTALVGRWHKPTYEFKVRDFLKEDPALRRAASKSQTIRIFNHRWTPPKWPYVEPLKDASTELLRQRNALTSPRRIQEARGDNWDTISSEIVSDFGQAIRKAKREAAAINKEFPDDTPVTWRECISLPTPDGVQVSLSGTDDVTSKQSKGEPGNTNRDAPQRTGGGKSSRSALTA